MRKARRKFECEDCLQDVGYVGDFCYIKDEVWEKISHKHGMLCLLCIEARLARTLNKHDFTDCWINKPNRAGQSQILRDRLTS